MQAEVLIRGAWKGVARKLEYEGSCHARRYRLHELGELSEGD